MVSKYNSSLIPYFYPNITYNLLEYCYYSRNNMIMFIHGLI